MNFGVARTRVLQMLSLQVGDDASVADFVNEAIVDFYRDAWPVVAPLNLETIAGQASYDLTRDVGAMEITQLRIVATGGTCTVTVGGQVTAATAWDATDATWVANLEALSTVDVGEVEVTIGDGDGSPDAPRIVLLRWLERADLVVTGSGASLTGPDADLQVTTLLEGGSQGVLAVIPDASVMGDLGVTMEVRGNVLVLDPVPTVSGTKLTGWVVPRPKLLVRTTDDAVEIPTPREWQRAIVYRAVQIGSEWDMQDPNLATAMEAKYETEVRKCRRARSWAAGNGSRATLQPSSQNAPLVWGDQFPWGSM